MRNRRRVRVSWWPQVIATCMILGVVGGVGFAVGHYARRSAPQQYQVAKSKPAANVDTPPNLKQYLPRKQFSGVAAVYRNGKRIETLAQGQATATTQNSAASMFEIDSVQKALTAGLVMHEALLGKLHLSDKLSQYYPQVPGADTITLRQLLDMDSGLSLHGSFMDQHYVDDNTTVHRLLAKLRYNSAMNGLGRYQAANYVVLVGILMKVTNQSYQSLVEEQYIKPLHLTHTRFAYEPNQTGVSLGHYLGKHGLSDATVAKTTSDQQHQELGTGQLLMSIDDLYTVESALLSGRYFKTNNASAMLFAPGSLSTYGGGFYQSRSYRSANGFGYGYECFVRITQSGRDAVIIMSNCSIPKYATELAADKLAQAWLTH